MKTKISKIVAALFFLLFINAQSDAQTVPFTNNLPCDVVIGFELRDANCNVCDFGQLTIPGNSTVNYTAGAACLGNSLDACIWVISIKTIPVAYNHMSFLNCCSILPILSNPDPSGCSSSGNYNVVNNYPTNWTINP